MTSIYFDYIPISHNKGVKAAKSARSAMVRHTPIMGKVMALNNMRTSLQLLSFPIKQKIKSEKELIQSDIFEI